MPLISRCGFCLKLAGAFCSIAYCLRALLEGFYKLYIFYHSFLTAFLIINNINEKYPTYMLLISCCGCCLKLAGTFRCVANCLKTLLEGFWLHMFHLNFLTICLYINNINKKYLTYAPLVTFYDYFCLLWNDAIILVAIMCHQIASMSFIIHFSSHPIFYYLQFTSPTTFLLLIFFIHIYPYIFNVPHIFILCVHFSRR